MESQSNYSHTDAVKSISNILREPAPRLRGELKETAADILSEPVPVPASPSGEESSETPAQSGIFAAHEDAKVPSPSNRKRNLRAVLWQFLVRCVEPVFARLRNYLLAPLHLRLDDHSVQAAKTQADTELIQVQLKLIRADLEYLPKQLAQVEVRYQSFAKQLAELESKFGILTDQL